MVNWSSLISKNRKVTIGIIILAVLLGLLLIVSLFSRLRNQQQPTQPANPTTQPTQQTVSIYSTTPSDKETDVPTNANITITFNEIVSQEDFSFNYSSDLKFKISQPTNNSFLLLNQSGFKPNQKYQFKVIIKNAELVFTETQQKEYSFSFTSGKDTLGEAIRKSVR